MAASKREHDGDISPQTNGVIKKSRTEHEDIQCQTFLTWCKDSNLSISNKVQIGKEGSVSQYGMVATEDIMIGECLFEIPRSLLLGPTNCGISKVLEEEASSLASSSGWLPLLVTLMYEYTSPSSKWKPYYSLVPDFNQLDLPMFWSREEVEENLAGTGVPEAVFSDVNSLEKEYHEKVKPFIEKHSDLFKDARCRDLDFFKKMVAFVMAYSFTEPPPDDDEDDDTKQAPMMVPMADILNHIAKSNAHLQFSTDSLRMEATRPIKKGQEVYNTYGELPNWQLLQMYGFAEKYPENHYDTVDIPMAAVLETFKSGKSKEELDLIDAKWNFLRGIDIITDQGMYVLGVEGILTEEEMYTTLKVMAMNKADFQEYKEKEGWSDDEENEEESESLTFDDIPSKPESWKILLKKIAENRLQDYPRSLEEEERVLKDTKWESASSRKQYACFVRYGQQKLLALLVETCSHQ